MARDILKNPFRFKTRFSVNARTYTPNEGEMREARASVERLKALMPEGLNPEDHPTMLYVVGNLFVGGLVNLNDDAVTIEDALRIYRAFEHQQVNIEHNRGDIRGFIVKAGLSELGTDRVITEEEARAASRPFNVAIVVALWKVADRELANYILQSDAPGSPTKDSLSFSFEVGFDDYSVVTLPKGTSNLALATSVIPSSDESFAKWDSKLRANKGSGQTSSGERVARVLAGDILPLGAGIVAVPAAAVKGLTPITEAAPFMSDEEEATLSEHLDAKTGVVGYPYGSKCPFCEAPTIMTSRTTSPDAPEGCSNGHKYPRYKAVRVETEAKVGVSYSYSSTQVDIAEAEAVPFNAFGATIPDEQLYVGEGEKEGKYGRENETHVTVLYGIMGNDATLLGPILAGFGPIKVTLGEVSAFENADKPYDVLKVDVISDDLHRLHELIKHSCECNVMWPAYAPHLTIAYLKKGYAKHYVGDKRFVGKEFTFNSLTFSPAQGERAALPLVLPEAQSKATEPFESPLLYKVEHEKDPRQVYINTPSSEAASHDLMSATISTTRHLKLSPGWQERLATIWAPSNGKPALAEGVTVTLSDGRVLKNVKVFDGETLELDKETSFHGVIITDMTPGVPPQADDSKEIHPNLGDVYPNKRPEKVAQEEEFRAEQERAQKAAYTDAALAIKESVAKLIAIINSFTQHAASASVSTITANSMTLDDLKTLEASVQKSDKIEDLKTAFANVALFAAEIAKASEEMAKARKEADEAAAGSKAALEGVRAELAALAKQHNDLVAAQQAAAAEQLYQERMASVAETFAFDDETRAEVVSEIKACADDAAFEKWMARAKKLYKGWLKSGTAAFPPKEDMKHEKEEKDEEECAKASREALASAAAKVVDAPVINTLDAEKMTSQAGSLKEQMQALANKIRIGGKTVEELNKEAAASVRRR